ncbi:MAG: hypothetical protein JEY97_09090 [Bacteroidales bacterium]|nr:hypothetical protein [Bacteroidales bacterium]
MNKAKHINRLKSLGAFWSYSPKGLKNISDNQLIEETLRWGDVAEIKQLFKTFQLEKIKEVWLSKLVSDERILPHNYYLANIFFDIEDPIEFINNNQIKSSRYARLKGLDAKNRIHS